MSKLAVPIGLQEDLDCEAVLAHLREIGAERVFIVQIYRALERDEPYFAVLRRVKERMEFFRAAGLEVGVWMTTIGYGSPVLPRYQAAGERMTHLRSITGQEALDAFCPLDEAFADLTCQILADTAALGPDLIMLDDELCLSVRPGIGCACDRHMAAYRRRLGKDISLAELPGKIGTGGKNRYRDAWLDLMGDTLRDFCRQMRRAVDGVDPAIRMGFCSGYTSWDMEGADAVELTRILAGQTAPFLRFTGAPYWPAAGRFGLQPLQAVVECNRRQYAYCREQGIEVFTEQDPYPHTRFHVPAAFLECFDLATLAAEDMDRLKYFFTYVSPLEYESGYIDAHKRHAGLREEISAVFGDKECTGIRVYAPMSPFREMQLPDWFIGEREIMQRWFSSAACMLSMQAIPTVHEGRGICGIAFGEGARMLDEEALAGGMIVDVPAALLLQQRGVDVGLRSAKALWAEYSEQFAEVAVTQYGVNGTYAMEVAEDATVLSRFQGDEGEHIATYLYENAAGQRFMVYGFSGDDVRYTSTTFRNYCRGRQIVDALPWLCGKSLPAACPGHPYLYCLCKQRENRVAVAYVNCHPDAIYDATVQLSAVPVNWRFVHCTGEVQGDKVLLHHVPAYGFAAIELEYTE